MNSLKPDDDEDDDKKTVVQTPHMLNMTAYLHSTFLQSKQFAGW